MPDFLEKFFPEVYGKTQDPHLNSNYCKYDNQNLQMFTSSLYLAGLVATFFASWTTRNLGRKPTMLIAGFFFLVGVVINTGACWAVICALEPKPNLEWNMRGLVRVDRKSVV